MLDMFATNLVTRVNWLHAVVDLIRGPHCVRQHQLCYGGCGARRTSGLELQLALLCIVWLVNTWVICCLWTGGPHCLTRVPRVRGCMGWSC
jgi:hypothetical protein